IENDCLVCGTPINYDEIVDGVQTIARRKYCRKCVRPENPITTVELVFRDQNWNCHLCGEAVEFGREYPHPLSPTVDHIIPLARGGKNVAENCALAHASCNRKKQGRLPEEFDLTA